VGVSLFEVFNDMASIAQAQAAFLKAGGLETGGIDRPAMRQVDPMQEILSKYIVEFLQTASDNLNKTGSITTGNLEESLDFDVTRTAGGYRIDFKALEYFKFVDKGVRGAGSSEKNQTSPYRFKYINPSKSHVQAIKKWITDNNLTAQVTDISRWGTYGDREAKGKNMPLKSAAWLIARNIKRKGLRATNFWTSAFDKTFKDFGAEMTKALGRTITVSLEQMKEDLANFKGVGQGKGVKIPKI
jgi:hypothetical protein